MNIETASEDEIEEVITAANLCCCKNPVTRSFEVSQCHSSYMDAYKTYKIR